MNYRLRRIVEMKSGWYRVEEWYPPEEKWFIIADMLLKPDALDLIGKYNQPPSR